MDLEKFGDGTIESAQFPDGIFKTGLFCAGAIELALSDDGTFGWNYLISAKLVKHYLMRHCSLV